VTASPKRTLLYAGPTLARARQLGDVDVTGLIVLSPIKRGDLAHAVRRGPPGIAIIADGYFHLENLSVGHAEIRDALARGWEIWGVSSMGAIRAAELHHLGMRGFGVVFERYRDDPELRDDEVALLHEPGPPYREVSEPLIHVRVLLDNLVARGLLSAPAASSILDDAMQRWFGERTIPWLRKLLALHVPADIVTNLSAELDRHRVKSHDLIALLRARPWL
jgi:hypothetical protein